MASNPSTTIPAVDAMRVDWALVDALMGGTKAMRKAGRTFLPQWPKEDQIAYEDRIRLSTLFPAYAETVKNMTGRVFAEPIVVDESVPAPIQALLPNIDNQGNNLQVWAREQFSRGLSHGITYAVVDFPKMEEGSTLADQQQIAARPYAVEIKPEQVLGWKSEVINGAQVLTQFRYVEWIEEDDPDDEFATKCVSQIRVLEPGSWRIYRQGKGRSKAYELIDEGSTTLDYIPLAVFYTNRTGFMTACPPLLELAHLNIKHWQSQSDQDNILHVARVPLLLVKGVDSPTSTTGEPGDEITVSTGAVTYIPNSEGDMKFVEHSGKAIEAGRQALQDLVDEMRMSGAKLLQKEKTPTKTATEATDDAATELSPLETMAEQFEDFLDQILQIMSDWLNLGEGGSVQVRGNFDIDFASDTSVPALLNMTSQGRLSNQTLFEEYQRRGVISADRSWEIEQERLSTQAPDLGAV